MSKTVTEFVITFACVIGILLLSALWSWTERSQRRKELRSFALENGFTLQENQDRDQGDAFLEGSTMKGSLFFFDCLLTGKQSGYSFSTIDYGFMAGRSAYKQTAIAISLSGERPRFCILDKRYIYNKPDWPTMGKVPLTMPDFPDGIALAESPFASNLLKSPACMPIIESLTGACVECTGKKLFIYQRYHLIDADLMQAWIDTAMAFAMAIDRHELQ